MSAPVKIRIAYDFRNPAQWRRPWGDVYRDTLDQIAWIDSELHGIDGIGTTEHHFFDDGYLPSSMAICGAIAARTERVTVATDLIPLPLHHPLRIAEDALVIDALSGGRFQLGVGAGYFDLEFEAFGANIKHRPSLLEEGIEIIRAAFRGVPFSYSGKRFEIPAVQVTPPPIREGGPEVWIGAQSPAGVDRAARIADGFICTTTADLDEWSKACDRHDRPPEQRHLARGFLAIIDEDPERAYAESGLNYMHMMNEYIVRGSFGLDMEPFQDPAEAFKVASEIGALVCADAAGAAAQFNEAIDRGATEISMAAMLPGDDPERVRRRLFYLSEQVPPLLKESDHPTAGVRPSRMA